MARDVPAARRMMSRLSDLLRLTLDEPEQHQVTLAQELRFLEQYSGAPAPIPDSDSIGAPNLR